MHDHSIPCHSIHKQYAYIRTHLLLDPCQIDHRHSGKPGCFAFVDIFQVCAWLSTIGYSRITSNCYYGCHTDVPVLIYFIHFFAKSRPPCTLLRVLSYKKLTSGTIILDKSTNIHYWFVHLQNRTMRYAFLRSVLNHP